MELQVIIQRRNDGQSISNIARFTKLDQKTVRNALG